MSGNPSGTLHVALAEQRGALSSSDAAVTRGVHITTHPFACFVSGRSAGFQMPVAHRASRRRSCHRLLTRVEWRGEQQGGGAERRRTCASPMLAFSDMEVASRQNITTAKVDAPAAIIWRPMLGGAVRTPSWTNSGNCGRTEFRRLCCCLLLVAVSP
jgi:hypothetical protein